MKKSVTILFFLSLAIRTFAVPADPALLQLLLESGDTIRYEQMLHHRDHAITQGRKSNLCNYSNVPGPACAPSLVQGNINMAPRGLVILANFSDVHFRVSNSRAEMDSMLNAEHYTFGNAYGSARQYFYDQSNGLYNPHFDVVGPIDLPRPMAYYGKNRTSDNYDAKAADMVVQACSLACQLPGVDFSRYDNDGDGFLDFVYIIYAGYGEADSGETNAVWPASWDIQSAIEDGSCSITDVNQTAEYTFGGKILNTYAYSGELRYHDLARCGIGTFCHEFSHVIGLPDYYDTFYGVNYRQKKTPGTWSLMDAGSYNCDGEVPPSYSAYDKYFMGWSSPELLATAEAVTLQSDGSGRYITMDNRPAFPTSPTIVYYLENRQNTGWDRGLPGHGLLIWKVKYNANFWLYNEPNSSYDTEFSQANKRNIISYSLYSATGYNDGIGTSSDSYPGSLHVNTTTINNRPLSNITEVDGIITFDYMGGRATGEEDVSAQEPLNISAKVYKDGHLYIQHNNHIYTLTGELIQ